MSEKQANNTIHSGQRQRWSLMTVLYLGVRSSYYNHSWQVVLTLDIPGALPRNSVRWVCLQG